MSRSRTRRWPGCTAIVVCVVAALWLAVAAASSAEPMVGTRPRRVPPQLPRQQPPPSPGAKRSLLIVGDSVIEGVQTYNALPALQAQLGSAWNPPVIDAAESRSTLAAPSVIQNDLQRIAPDTFDTVIVALGYNDGGTAAVFESRVKPVLDLLRNIPHVYWLTLREFGQFADGYHQSNVGLRSAITSYPNAAILDWNAFSKTLPNSAFTVDGNHLSPNLAQVMATFIANAANGKSRHIATAPTTTARSASSVSTPSNAIPTVGNAGPGATGEHNSLLIGLLVGGVVLISFAIAAWAGSRRMRAGERDERRSQWDEKLGITHSDVATSNEDAEEGDTADLGEAVASEEGRESREETADDAAVDDEAVEPTPVDATIPPRDDGP